MGLLNYRRIVENWCARAGIEINGSRPFDIRVHDQRFFERIVKDQSIGFGETYMDKWWDCERLDLLFEKIYGYGMNRERMSLSHALKLLHSRLVNIQNPIRSRKVNEVHYDLGNDLYQRMLGPSMVYTCGNWQYAKTLEEAQVHKLDIACRKMNLKPGQRILDIGCGFGSLLKHAVTNYGVEGVGVTLSKQQQQYAQKNCEGLPIEIRLEDYRSVKGEFDRIISIGMFEAVGHQNFRTYMETCDRVLKKDGAVLLHTIGSNWTAFPVNHWVDKYIFPDGYLPSLAQIADASEKLFLIEDLHNFGPSYQKTLLAWHENFVQTWPEIADRYGERFKRMWEFYLLSFAGGFKVRHFQLWQIVLAKPGADLADLNKARLP